MIDYSYVYNGGGVGIADLDNDGLPEVLFTGNQQASKLYQNQGAWQFKDITQAAGVQMQGWCTGVTFADINADGLLDIYICRSGNVPPEQRSNLCFLNLGGLRFREAATELGIADTGWSTQAAFFDYDHDGDLDLYVLNHTNEDRYPNRIKTERSAESSATDHLYRNDGGIFKDASQESGIADDGWGLGLGLGDFNQDGWTDLYIGNDFLANDILYLNQRNGNFLNAINTGLGHTSHFSMGTDVADFDNDGLSDIFVADMMPSSNLQRKKMAGVLSPQAFSMTLANGYAPQYMRNTLQKNEGTHPDSSAQGIPKFNEIGQLAGVNATDWSWSPLFLDLDGDGWKDLFISNGYRHDIIDMDFILQNNELGKRMPLKTADQQIKEKARLQPGYAAVNQFFKNQGDFVFSNETQNWIAEKPDYSNGAAYGDLDGDGDLDLLVNKLDAAPGLYENQSQNANWLKIKLEGPANNPFAFGATVKVFGPNKMVQQQALFSTRGYQSASSTELVFGLGKAVQPDSVQVIWPGGKTQTVVPKTQENKLNIGYQPKQINGFSPLTRPWFQAQNRSIPWVHRERTFIDYHYEPLLPHGFSSEGPALCSGDLNGDGLVDVFVGGAAEQSGVLLIQQKNGAFNLQRLESDEKKFEDNAATFFDADGDQDLDLFVCSGSNEYAPGDSAYQNRLYLNQGPKGWMRAQGRIPQSSTPSSAVCAADFDGDGDQDLFVGGRRKILHYGQAGNSQLLVNDGRGYFRDESEQQAPGLKNCGMVRSAQWADLDGDQKQELIVAGEFMPIGIWKQKKDRLVGENIPGTEGFWNTLTTGDLDGDGDLDLIAGNLGLNHKYNISPTTPLQLFGADYDQNGNYEAILTYHLEGQQTPLHGREDLLRQIPALRKTFTDYTSYASAKWQDILPPPLLKKADQKQIVCSTSAWFENRGKGGFALHPLPRAAQTAPINAFLLEDLNGDQRLDILAVGNQYDWEISSGHMDASIGWVLINKGQGKFKSMPSTQTGFRIPGEGRALVSVQHEPLRVLVVRNAGGVLFYGL